MGLLKDSERLITGEELLHFPDLGPCELVDGRIVPLPPATVEHGEVEANLGSELRAWARSSGRGRALGGGVGLYIRRNPDTVRAVDILFISKERDLRPRAKGYFEIAPELVVEVLSPDDRMSPVREKLRDYFSAGVRVVWVVDSALRRVLVHRSLTDFTVLDDRQ
ncbi:MAG TPA: Uma2 family endonuclease, partial [Thermoanaerobaculia bacterium]